MNREMHKQACEATRHRPNYSPGGFIDRCVCLARPVAKVVGAVPLLPWGSRVSTVQEWFAAACCTCERHTSYVFSRLAISSHGILSSMSYFRLCSRLADAHTWPSQKRGALCSSGWMQSPCSGPRRGDVWGEVCPALIHAFDWPAGIQAEAVRTQHQRRTRALQKA
jgi:hypothetical protein